MSNQDRQQPRGIGWGYFVYQQVAGVIGAFALIALISHFFDIGWRGFLANLIGIWGEYVRPAVKWLFDISIVALLQWTLGWRIEIPLFVRDYFSVGLALIFGRLRAWRYAHYVRTQRGDNPDDAFDFESVTILALDLFAWPLTAIRDLGSSAYWVWVKRSKLSETGFMLTLTTVILSPLLYLALLLAASYVLLKPGS